MIHHDRVDRPENDADERDCDGTPNEGRHEPDDDLEPDCEEGVDEDDVALADLC